MLVCDIAMRASWLQQKHDNSDMKAVGDYVQKCNGIFYQLAWVAKLHTNLTEKRP